MPYRLNMQWVTVAMISASIAFLGGCDDDDCPTTPHPGQERIAGQIIGGDGPVPDVRVRVEGVHWWSDGETLETSESTDEEGFFDLPVPPGDYRVSINGSYSYDTFWYSSSGPQTRAEHADTIRIINEGDTADLLFLFGGLEITTPLPTAYMGHSVRYYVRDSSFANTYGSRSVSYPYDVPAARLPLLPPGKCLAEVQIRSRDDDWESTFWLPPTLDRNQAESIEINPSQMTVLEVPVLEPCVIRGTFMGQWDNFGSGKPSVEVYTPDSVRIGEADTNDFGEFEIPLFAPGRVRIRVHLNYSELWLGQENHPGGQEFDIVPGTNILLDPIWVGEFACNIEMDPAWDGPHAAVEVYDQNETYIDGHSCFRNDFVGIPIFFAGTYKIKVVWHFHYSKPWRPQWFDRSTSFETAASLSLSEGNSLEDVHIVLERGGTIRGQVYTASGNPANSKRLVVRSTDGGWNWSHQWKTAGDRVYLIEGLPDGEFIVGSSHDVYSIDRITWYPGVADEDSAEVISIIDAGDVTGINFQLLP